KPPFGDHAADLATRLVEDGELGVGRSRGPQHEHVALQQVGVFEHLPRHRHLAAVTKAARKPESSTAHVGLCGECDKWLCAPKGAGFLYVRPELQDVIQPAIVRWGFEGEATFLSRLEKQGTRDPAAYLTVPAAIQWQQAHDWDAVRERSR